MLNSFKLVKPEIKHTMSNKIEMVITDLDGTLLRDNKEVSKRNNDTFRWLGQQNICRVAATGRTLFNTAVLDNNFPLDYMIFSSGAGIMDWKTREIIMSYSLSAKQVDYAVKILISYNISFNIYSPIPDNHCFARYNSGNSPEDLIFLYEKYKDYISDCSGQLNL